MEPIHVFLRIRPFMNSPGFIENQNVETVQILGKNNVSIPSQSNEIFSFDFVGNKDTKQVEVFNAIGKRAVEKVVEGYNSTIFAYGQTGSGKTYTMQGGSQSTLLSNVEERGLIPRCFEYLFEKIREKREHSLNRVEYLCRVSYIEIYNENIYDLLDINTKMCMLREDIKKGVFVDGVIEETVFNADEAFAILIKGANNRRVGETSMNRESSRSHSLFTLVVQSMTMLDGGLREMRESKFNLVDLAGSERQKFTGAVGTRLKEAASINKSLSALGTVINALAESAITGRQRHVNYRDSRLTFLLKDSLGGNSVTAIVANVSPSISSDYETISTLRFAQRAKLIKNRVVVNQDTKGDVVQFQKEIARLRSEVSLLRDVISRSNSSGSQGVHTVGGYNNAQNDQITSSDWLAYLAIRRLDEESRQKSMLSQSLLQLHLKSRKQYQQIQQLKLIVKLRNSENQALRNQSPAAELSQMENSSLRAEVDYLSRQLSATKDIDDLVLENIQLKAMVEKLELLNQGYQTNGNELPKIEELTDHLENVISLNYSGVMDKIPIEIDRSEITLLENNIVNLQNDISELELQRDQLSNKIGGMEHDWGFVLDTMMKLEGIGANRRGLELIEKNIANVVSDEPKKALLLLKNIVAFQDT